MFTAVFIGRNLQLDSAKIRAKMLWYLKIKIVSTVCKMILWNGTDDVIG